MENGQPQLKLETLADIFCHMSWRNILAVVGSYMFYGCESFIEERVVEEKKIH